MGLVTGALGSLLPKLGELLKEEYSLQKGVKKKVERLSWELRFVQAVLRKIGDMPPDQRDELVRLWVCDLREASYAMEDIIDAFLVRIDGGGGPKPADTNMLGRLLKKVDKLFEKIKNHREISKLIKDIYKKLEEVAERRGRYTLDGIVANPVATNTIDPRLLNLYKRAADLVGIEGPRDDLIDMLSLGDDGIDVSDKKVKIVSVVGFGGLGKTTLAKSVYDHLKPRFECGAFVPVGRNPDMKKVFRDILIDLDRKQYRDSKMMMLDEKQLMDELKEFIKEKRYFIVIDDMWDKDSWKLIRCALQESNYASRVVITTRISEVATLADGAYKMQPLSRDASEKLLYARITDGEGKYFDSPSAQACERILKKCGGVPLAIITIASLLASKPGEDWSEVYNSIGFGRKGNNDVDNTRRILSFSYYDLPSHLKDCLLYLSFFPEDDFIEKNSLIWMWKAEGFISEEQAAAAGVGLFELGERYFNELINRNMIQAIEDEYEGHVDYCSVHDMVLDLIHHLSSEENFVTVLNGGERRKLQGSISRRLALQCVEKHSVSQLANVGVEKVRSIFAGRCDFCALCPHLPFLRVVQIVGCSVSNECSKNVPDHLGSLLHLRYLRLEYITELPREVRYLRFLQTLDLYYSWIEELPEEVGLLTQLVCLRCSNRTRVPAGLIGKLTSLQELCIWRKGDEDATMQFVKELGHLRELRVLRAYIHDVRISESIGSALLESLGHQHDIQELKIQSSPSKDWVSDSGSLTCRHLRFLDLDCLVFAALPAWINSSLAPNISYLDVKVVVVKDHDMETLAKLPELSCFTLNSKSDTKSVVSIKIRTDEGVVYFRKLRFLKIYGSISIWFDLRGSECNSSRVASSNTIMPSLEALQFDVHVRSLKDKKLQLGFDKMLGFQDLGRSSLQRVDVQVNCEGASIWDVKEAEAALKHAAAVHPKHPTLLSERLEDGMMMSLHEEASMEMSRAPKLVTKAWKLVDIVGSAHIQILRMPDPTASSSRKVTRLLYTNNGMALLALSSNAVHKVWKWEHSDKNPRGKLSKSVPPVSWQPKNVFLMTNDTTDGNNPEEATACTAISNNGSYLISASGGKISLFNMNTFKVMTTFMPSPPATTYLAFDPQDNNIIAIGREDSSIQIYNTYIDEVTTVLTGHQKKITGLAFLPSMEVLVSADADAQLCVWCIDGWEKMKSRYIKYPSNGSGALVGDTMVQSHYDETRLLVVHESQLAIYDWQLECLCSWFQRDALPAPISSAVYSLGCLLVYAGFRDGAIGIFEAESLKLQCRIAPSAYIPSSISRSGEIVYPTVVATHPWKPNHIAVGMSDGAVCVLEPLNTDGIQACMEVSRAPELVIKGWKLADIIASRHIQILRMPDPEESSSKVMRLLYTNNGVALLALSSNAVHKLWKWEHDDKNPRGKSFKSVPPILWHPENGILKTNDTTDGNDPEEATTCTALSKNDRYLISAFGGKVSLFNMWTFKVITTFKESPPAATFLAFHPLDINIIAIGCEDSSIQIINARTHEVNIVLTGHHKEITGLAFSQSMLVLVSSCADAQLCVWSIDDWEKKKSRYIKHPSNGSGALVGDTIVQFHYDQTHLLVVHETQLAIYDWQLECLCSWFPRDALPAPISSAVYSLGCVLVYAGFCDGAIGIFEAESLTLQCKIAPSAYIPCSISCNGETVYPTAVATHPWKPNRIAVGMSDGAVLVLEPLDTDEVQSGERRVHPMLLAVAVVTANSGRLIG